jgi:hypothetical protein
MRNNFSMRVDTDHFSTRMRQLKNVGAFAKRRAG